MNSNKLRVLVVEDEPTLRENIAQFLELKKFKVTQAKNGLEADYLLKKANPDLIICDVSMPFMNGLQLLSQLRKDDQYNHIPFIFLTAKADKDDLRLGMISGADDYIIKPFTFDELFTSIQKRVERLSQIRKNYQRYNVNDVSISLSSTEEHAALSAISTLSKKELSILKKIGKGLTSSMISQELNSSIRTIENHRYNICKKLKLKGSNSLSLFAMKFRSQF
jgi:DNA-binding NarL/FixJ family response regulator